MKRRYENRFEGSANKGLRARIRDAVAGLETPVARADAVRLLAGTVALTAAGRHTLALVALDYQYPNTITPYED